MPPRRELPHLINKQLSWESAARAIQENFDALTGEVSAVDRILEDVVSGAALEDVTAVIAETISNNTVSDLTETLSDAGVGPPDGEAPSAAPTGLQVIGGVGNLLFLVWDTIANSSEVVYKVYVNTSDPGDPPAANTFVGTFNNPGVGGGKGTFTLREFPTGHPLAGTNPLKGTTYRARVVSSDDDGDGPTSGVATGSPQTVDANSIVAAGTIVGALVAANEIVSTHIASINLNVIQAVVSQLSAITANLGTVNSGTLNGVTFNSIGSGSRITITAALADEIRFITSGGGNYGGLSGDGSASVKLRSSGVTQVEGTSVQFRNSLGGAIDLTNIANLFCNGFVVGTTTPTVSAGQVRIYKSGNSFIVEDSTGKKFTGALV